MIDDEDKIPTSTIGTIQADRYAEVLTFFDDKSVDTIEAIITSTVGRKNGIKFKEGDLMIDLKPYPKTIDFVINGKGELIAIGKNCDNYSIDSDTGELKYLIS